ncbi:MAG: LysM peptidoglycan-binding domain-containing protein [Myxococcota bacterium]
MIGSSPRRRLLLTALALGVACTASSGCRGPDERPRGLSLDVDPDLLARRWEEGPRRDAVEALVQREGRQFARRLFVPDPMPSGMPNEGYGTEEMSRTVLAAIRNGARAAGGDEPPKWWHGAPPRPDSVKHDLPKEWIVEVERGETVALLARWSGQESDRIREDNREVLHGRRYLRVGDPLRITMSANQKLAFDQAREGFRAERLEGYFSKHWIEEVVVYVVQRGDAISKVARRYGEVPMWLLEEFNQADFRTLQPGDTVLIPVVAEVGDGRDKPPKLQVVDKDGRPLTAGQRGKLSDRMPEDLLRRARLAIDDSNVFERDRASAAARGILPTPDARPRQGGGGRQVAPRPARADEEPSPRKVTVRPGETLSHFAAWSGLDVAGILEANDGLDPTRMSVGQRVILPLTDSAYARFVLGRAGEDGGRRAADARGRDRLPNEPAPSPRRPPTARIAPGPGGSAGGSAPAVKVVHEVRRGETASGIAARYGVSQEALGAANSDRDLDRLYAGERLSIPAR